VNLAVKGERVAAKWRAKRNLIVESDSVGTRKLHFKSGVKTMLVFSCPVCKNEVLIQRKHIPYSTGRCKKHAQMLRPYEAVYGAMRKNAKERKLKFLISYDDYLLFTNKDCYFCGNAIPWNPYNRHGVNSPGYYLDRLNPNIGYIIENCVPCCTCCNMMKRSLSEPVFINQCVKIAVQSQSIGGTCGS